MRESQIGLYSLQGCGKLRCCEPEAFVALALSIGQIDRPADDARSIHHRRIAWFRKGMDTGQKRVEGALQVRKTRIEQPFADTPAGEYEMLRHDDIEQWEQHGGGVGQIFRAHLTDARYLHQLVGTGANQSAGVLPCFIDRKREAMRVGKRIVRFDHRIMGKRAPRPTDHIERPGLRFHPSNLVETAMNGAIEAGIGHA